MKNNSKIGVSSTFLFNQSVIGSRFIPQKSVKKSTVVTIEPNHFEDGAASQCFLQFLDYLTSKFLHLLTDFFDM